MSEVNINDFLNKLGKETVSRINRERKAYEKPTQRQEESKKPEVDTPKKRTVSQPAPIAETKPKSQHEETLHEEETSKALKFGTVMIDTIKSTFDTDYGRRMAYESIRNAVNMILGEQQSVRMNPVVENKFDRMSEAEYDSMPTVSHENPEPQQINEVYQGDMGIKGNGKQVDLSGVTSKDVADFRELAGLTE